MASVMSGIILTFERTCDKLGDMLKMTSFSKLILILSLAGLAGCNFASNDDSIGLEDASASGALAAIIGGAIYAGNPTALSGNTCPVVTAASGCSNVSGGVSLSYGNCSYGQNSGTRYGSLSFISAGLTCGGSATMPSSAIQQYGWGSSQTSSNEVTTGIDDLSTNLLNFDSQTIAPLTGSAYGVNVTYSGNTPTAMTISRRVATRSASDFSVNSQGGGSIAISGGVVTASGVTIYDNRLWIVGTASTSDLTYSATCCFPVGGTITTAFVAGTTATTPQPGGLLYTGKSETLTFTGCGTATLKDAPTQQTTNLAFTHCF